MSIVERARRASDMIVEQLDELAMIVEGARNDSDFARANEALRRWKARTVRLLTEQVGAREGHNLQGSVSWVAVVGQPLKNLESDANRYRGFLESLCDELETHPDDVFASADSPDTDVPASISSPEPRIFIIHGRDEANLLKLKNLLSERWKLRSIVLLVKAGGGRTIIEKFEQEANKADYAIALLTDDDLVASEQRTYVQPRPNVIFELGWFYGRLGRSRVCILSKKGIKIHSDLHGINRIDFARSVEEKVGEIERELKAAKLVK